MSVLKICIVNPKTNRVQSTMPDRRLPDKDFDQQRKYAKELIKELGLHVRTMNGNREGILAYVYPSDYKPSATGARGWAWKAPTNSQV